MATFAAREELPAGTNDQQYWESLLPEAAQVRGGEGGLVPLEGVRKNFRNTVSVLREIAHPIRSPPD